MTQKYYVLRILRVYKFNLRYHFRLLCSSQLVRIKHKNVIIIFKYSMFIVLEIKLNEHFTIRLP